MKANVNYSSRFRILKGGKISLVVSALLGSATLSFAAPSGGVVTSGNATINQVGKTTNINQSTSKASINWQKFGIKADEVVNFIQPDKNSITLNRVIGNERSIIDGALNANGQVWILNSNGVLFGKNASINTSGLLATTKNLSDTDFQSGNYNFSGDSTESIINQGTIKIKDNGYVILASNEVRNFGEIEAVKGRVQLTGADEYTINLNGNSLVDLVVDKGVLDALVENSGTILADGGEVYLTTHAVDELLRGVVNNTGIIEANSLDGINAHVELFAHGGTANIDGTIKAKGGFIETSGKELNVASTTSIETSKWLLDPINMTIESTGGADLSGASVSATAIQSALSSADVELQADQDITVNENINWGDATKLTLTAGDEIYVNATIENTNDTDGGVYFNAANTSNKVIFDTNGKVIINNINQLQWISQALNGNYELGSNIDASDTSTWNSDGSGGYYGFDPIGDNSTKFAGTFNGNGYTILDLYINRPSNYIGLFGYTAYVSNTPQTSISNLGLINANISGYEYVGGLVGMAFYSSISNSYARGNVTGDKRVGGLVGDNSTSTISNSYSTVTVNGNTAVGGLVGRSNSSSKITNSYALGNVSGSTYVGGLIGINHNANIQNSYYDRDTTGQANSIGSGSSTGITGIYSSTNTVNAFDENTYVGFDFTNDWIIYEGHTRPLLRAFMTELTVKANDITRTYDGTIYSGNGGVTYSIPTYDSSLVHGTLNYTLNGDLKNAGTATVNVDGLYSISQQGYIIKYELGTLTTNKKSITANYTAENKVYDGTTSANVNGTLTGIISGETVTLSQNANFVDKNVGTNKSITGLSLEGIDSANYFISSSNSATADITKKELSANYTADNKVYDGTTSVVVNGTLSGIISGDTVILSNTSANFTDKNAGTGKTVNIAGISLDGVDSSNYSISNTNSTTADITKKELSANYTADNKVYDGTTSAVVNGFLDGIISGDNVTFNNTSSNFENKNVGTSKTVTIDGITLSGLDASNYSISNTSSATADINKRGIAANYTAENKVYDGTTSAVVNGALAGMLVGDIVALSQNANFVDKNAGNGKSITGLSLTGDDSGNYFISSSNSATANITKKPISANYTAGNKVYDGTTSAVINGTLTGMLAGDIVALSQNASFVDKNVGNGKSITGLSLTGDDSGNYFISSSNSVTADITKKNITANFSVNDKVYDGTTSATASLDGGLSGLVSGDNISLDSFLASFSDKNTGDNKTVNITNISLSGSDSSNYTISSSSSSTASITPKELSANFSVNDKVYDGTTSATASLDGGLSGLVSGDNVSLDSFLASFSDKNVGDNKAISISNISLSGSGSSNYTISSSSSSTASITPKELSATFTANDKVYDGTDSATASLDGSLSGLISGDDVSLDSFLASFSDKNAGENKTVNITDISLSGDDMKNYIIKTNDSTSTTAIINKALATVTVDNKEVVYNGETHTIDSFSVNDLVNNEDKSVLDSISISGSGKNAGTYTILALGEDDNYNLEFIDGELTITPKLINVTYTANNKEYDGSTFAIANGSLSGVIQGDDIQAIYSSANFEDENPANNKNVYIEGISLSGSDSQNYALAEDSYIATASINNSLGDIISSIVNGSTINSIGDLENIDFNSLDINPEEITNSENIITDLLQQGEISFPIINGIVLRVLDGGINMSFGTQRQLILNQEEDEKKNKNEGNSI